MPHYNHLSDEELLNHFRRFKDKLNKRRGKWFTTTDRRGEYGRFVNWNECRVVVDGSYSILCKIQGIKEFQLAKVS